MQQMTETALQDSAAMKQLTEAAVRDSAAMKQIAYLTMAFLPASFVSVGSALIHSFLDAHYSLDRSGRIRHEHPGN